MMTHLILFNCAFFVMCLVGNLLNIQMASKAERVSDGILLNELGTFNLIHSSPLVFEINDYTSCVGEFVVCYRSDKTESYDQKCEVDYCSLTIDTANLENLENSVKMVKNTLIVTVGGEINGCPPDTSSEKQTYIVKSVPSECVVNAKGAIVDSSAKLLDDDTTTKTYQSEKSETNKVIIYVVCSAVGGVIILITLFALVYCFYWKPRHNEAARNRLQSQGTSNNVERVNLLPPTTTTTLATTTTTTVTNTDNRKDNTINTKPDVTPSRANNIVPKSVVKTPVPTPTKAEETVASKIVTKTEETHMASKTNTVTFGNSIKARRSLRAQKTQDSPTGSEGTPPITYDAAQSMKKTSIFAAKHYIPNAQSHVPYRKKKKLDSMEQLFPIGESVLASFERQKHLSKTIQMVVADRWNLEVAHEMHPLEKHVLRDVIEIAFPALEKLIVELDGLLLEHGAKFGLGDSSTIPWDYVNTTNAAASAAIRLLMNSYPSIGEGLQPRMQDSIIAELSVPAMYALLFCDKFDSKFKKELIIELRARACILLRDVPLNNLMSSPHPLPYLAKRFKASRSDFVIGIVPKKGLVWHNDSQSQDV